MRWLKCLLAETRTYWPANEKTTAQLVFLDEWCNWQTTSSDGDRLNWLA
jgi:hypothetical protein